MKFDTACFGTIGKTVKLLALSLLPLLMSGCLTANTIAFTTSEHTR